MSVQTINELTLEDLDHDSERDRPTHLFPAGHDASVPQRAYCGTLVQPPFRPRHSNVDLCIVCNGLRDAS